MIKPSSVQPGETIGIVAPASSFDVDEFHKGIRCLENLGFRVRYREDIFSKYKYLAGTDERRAAELMDFFTDPSIKAILCARGGYGTSRLLPLLDFDQIKKFPKVLIGYSDISLLLLALQQSLSWVVFHGPVVAKTMGEDWKFEDQASFFHCLTNSAPLGEVRRSELVYLNEGCAKGVLTGGCLSIMCSSLGTPYEIEPENKILFLEEVNEKPYAIDRMLTQLKLSGKFRNLRGIVFGPFKNSGLSTRELQEFLIEVLGFVDFPVVFGFPSGHLESLMTIPFGVEVELDSKTGAINFVEGALLNAIPHQDRQGV